MTRHAIRMAIGQLADYGRLLEPPPTRAILVPEQPRPDLLKLAATQSLKVAWPSGASYETTAVQTIGR